MFSLGAGHFQGYQLTFFLLHGLAVVATLRVRPRGWTAIPWVVLTLAFNLASGVLFLASLHQIAPIHSNQLPDWLAGW